MLILVKNGANLLNRNFCCNFLKSGYCFLEFTLKIEE